MRVVTLFAFLPASGGRDREVMGERRRIEGWPAAPHSTDGAQIVWPRSTVEAGDGQMSAGFGDVDATRSDRGRPRLGDTVCSISRPSRLSDSE